MEGSYRIISGLGIEVSAIAFGNGKCVQVPVNVDRIDNLVSFSAY